MITLFLMTKKGYCVLQELISRQLNSCISEIVIGRDENTTEDYADQIIEICQANKINYYERPAFETSNSEYSIAISWRWLIPINKSKLIVLHDSLLPKYRGFAPLVSSLINKEPQIGVTAIFASSEYDTGDIIKQLSVTVTYPTTIHKAIDLITPLYAGLVSEILLTIKDGKNLSSTKQNHSEATYSLWRDEEDYLINWSDNSEDILNFINSVSEPYLGASTYLNKSKKIRITSAELCNDVNIENREAGKVIFVEQGFPVIVCGKGLIKITTAIDESGKSILPLNKFRSRFGANC